ncbi:SagB/ThcOx family dehydrogenase [Microbacterium deminutum]|uniref:SagB/ThcOx family dehydrogenase n=2 Tax=Microbacterium deminutum TaxID=344164 RepID=A0ABN2RJ32_9MICO
MLVENYLTGKTTELHPALLAPLNSLADAVSWSDAQARFGGDEGAREILAALLSQDVLLDADGDPAALERRILTEWPWGRDSLLFHLSTRRTRFAYDLDTERQQLVALARESPPPPPYKDYGRDDIPLPASDLPDVSLADVLARRRTGRAFSGDPVTMRDLATILRTCWGVSSIHNDPGVGPVVLKTSPSGGARHPVEVYCIAQNVDGLEAGTYHFSAGRNALARLSAAAPSSDRVLEALTGQPWVADAAAVFLMTAVTKRSAWKYRQSHAYRVILLDAGHLGQTFHLVCTALGLAPWTSAAIDEAIAEELLGLDDPSEIVLYAAACGRPREP